MNARARRYVESLARTDEEIEIGKYIREQTDSDRQTFRQRFFQKGSGQSFTGRWKARLYALAESRPELAALIAGLPDHEEMRARRAKLAEERYGGARNERPE